MLHRDREIRVTAPAVDDPRLWRLLAAEIGRRWWRRLRVGAYHALRFAGATPERILVAPPDLRPGDRLIARDIYAGHFRFAGRLVSTRASPFGEPADDAFAAELHGFRWLVHLRAAATDLSSANARALVGDWLVQSGPFLHGIAWQPDVVARRLIAWLQHAPLILAGAELPFYRAFLRSLAMQVRYLRAVAPTIADGEARLRARIALSFAALALPSSPRRLAAAGRQLAAEIEVQILPDGGHLSRNPAVLPDLLADLLPLRQTHAAQAETPPAALVNAIDRMLPALRFFLGADGSLARFNGAGAVPAGLIAAVLAHDEARGAPLLSAPHSGYQRLAVAGVTVICDTGAPPPLAFAGAAHAGTLSFEFSIPASPLIVNAGVNQSSPAEWRRLGRATAAHSTAVIADRSQARFAHSARTEALLGTPLAGGPRHVVVERRDSAGVQAFRASHDGYAGPFGLLHERSLALTAGRLAGADRFVPVAARPALPAALRFHVHPAVALARDGDGRIALTSGSETWLFGCDREATVEETILFADPAGPRKAMQIVVDLDLAAIDTVTWHFTRIESTAA